MKEKLLPRDDELLRTEIVNDEEVYILDFIISDERFGNHEINITNEFIKKMLMQDLHKLNMWFGDCLSGWILGVDGDNKILMRDIAIGYLDVENNSWSTHHAPKAIRHSLNEVQVNYLDEFCLSTSMISWSKKIYAPEKIPLIFMERFGVEGHRFYGRFTINNKRVLFTVKHR